MNYIIAVDDLVRYHETAESRLAAATEYMSTIEASIKKHHAVDIDAWRKEEREWQSKVVDIKNHKGLGNPYEPAQSAGTRAIICMFRANPGHTGLTTKAIAAHMETEGSGEDTRQGSGIMGAIEEVLRLREDA